MSEWKKVKLGDLLKEYCERNINNEYIPVAVGKYGIRKREDIYTKELSKDISKNKVIKKDTLTIGMGSNQIDIGILANDEKYCVSPAYTTYKIKNCNSKFLEYYMEYLNPKLSDLFMIISARQGKSVDKEGLLNYELMLPPIEEQENIVNLLKKLDYIINKYEELVTEKKQFIKTQFEEMTKDIINKVELNYFAYGLNAGKSLAGKTECKNKVLKTGSVSYDYFDEKEIKNLPINYIPNEKHKVKKGDVIISRMNTAELVGACGYVWNNIKDVYYPDRLWRLDLKENCNPIFIWQAIIQREFKEKIKLICSGTSGSMKNISQAKFLKLKIKNVPIDIQNKFAKLVKQIYKQNFLLEKQKQNYKELKKGLMQQLLTGKVKVNV